VMVGRGVKVGNDDGLDYEEMRMDARDEMKKSTVRVLSGKIKTM
jgi:hypothetical protein